MLDISPYQLVIASLLVIFFKQIVGKVGKEVLEENGWRLYTTVGQRLGDAKLKELGNRRAELAKIDRERKSISAQDEYARWTKLNRRFDKLSGETEKLAESQKDRKAQLGRALGVALFATTSLPIWVFRIWFRKAVLFYFPAGTLPYALEYVLALPFVPTGGVGLTVWMFACNSVISSLLFMVCFPFQASVPPPARPTNEKEDKTAPTETSKPATPAS
ncbi:Piso0_000835 [Millerozyma farinosa CBS 7064]|uniref:Golgi to ER traffic protein 1 n=1 Tax=Pichia sorbitophila (strain ATCC MYA-4447 / BCRC 22081 / CBS 7064 / NBRC 10061 / NRRL Y-12695) TaxID=559304 RepID=G8YRN1_PICSO|nr:Piso0_000835 [Millerozyma farinosa CBS 7064]